MEKKFRLIFSGEIAPGRLLADVKAGLPELMKIPPEQVGKLFSGQPVVIKRGLPEAKLAAYQALLDRAGLVVRVEVEAPELMFSLDPEPPVAKVAPLAASVSARPVSPVEEVTCPKCGHRQPKRTLCLECGLDMPGYAAAQAAAKTETLPSSSPYASTASSSGSYGYVAQQEELPPVLAFNLDGRLNRVRYMVYGLVMQAVMTIAGFMLIGSLFTSMSGIGGFPIFLTVLFVALLLAVAFFGIRFTVQRLHDMGHTGWLVLLIFVPVIGGLAGIWFMIWPGNKEENLYGLPNPPNSTVHYVILIGALVLILTFFGLMVRKAMVFHKGMMQMQSAPYSQGMPSSYPYGDGSLKPRR